MSESRSIGVFGGSFDPVHYGHLRAAEMVVKALELDSLVFVPAGNQYQKSSKTSPEDRLAMLRLAIAGHSSFEISTVDIDRGGQTYTFDTLSELSESYKGDKLFFILGADAAAGLGSWHRIDETLDLVQFVVISRPGTEFDTPPVAKGRVWYLEVPALDISSTNFRKNYGLGTGYESLVPRPVLTYIQTHHLYQEDRTDE